MSTGAILYETHMHTPLCKHARGKPAEYAAAARERRLAGIIVNFKVLQHTIRRGFSSQGVMNATKFFIILKYYLRLLVLGAIICYLIKRGWVHPIGLAVGLSTVVVSIVSFGIKTAFGTVTGEAT